MSMINSLDISTVVLNGITLVGWAEDEDALSLPDSVELAYVQRGADGLMAVGGASERGGEVTIKLLSSSPSVQKLQGFVLTQRTGAYVTWNGIITYNNGSKIGLINGVLKKAPFGFTLGKGAPKNMEYVFEFSNIEFETITGQF